MHNTTKYIDRNKSHAITRNGMCVRKYRIKYNMYNSFEAMQIFVLHRQKILRIKCENKTDTSAVQYCINNETNILFFCSFIEFAFFVYVSL